MKTTRTNTLALFLLPVLTVLSCSKDIPSNPQEMDFAAASFSVGIMEKRCYMDYTYVLPQDEPPVVTAWNTVTLRAESDDAAFNGVNVSSSDPSVVSVERTEDPAEYTIVYRSDGKADIRVWNVGEEKSFRIEAREAIELEGLLMKVNGREFVVKADSSLPGPFADDYPAGWTTERYSSDMVYFSDLDYDEPYEVEIVDLVPSNASWRMIARLWAYNTAAGDMKDWFDPDYREGWEFTRYDIRDASFITGRKAVLQPNVENTEGHNAKFLIVTFKTGCRDYSTPQNEIGYTTVLCARVTR